MIRIKSISTFVLYCTILFVIIDSANVRLICNDDRGPYVIITSESKKYDSSSNALTILRGNDTNIFPEFRGKNCSQISDLVALSDVSRNKHIFHILNQIDVQNIYLDIKIDDRRCSGVVHPAELVALFGIESICSWNQSEINLQSGDKLPESEFDSNDICTCFWKRENFLVVNSSTLYSDTNSPRIISLAPSKRLDLTFRDNEPASLNLTYSFDDRDAYVNVTWRRSEALADEYDPKPEPEVKKYEVRQRLDDNSTTIERLNLGKADFADSGNYHVTVFSPFRRAYVAERTFTVYVESNRKPDIQLYVRDSVEDNRTKKLNPKFLRVHESYRFYCKAAAYPYPALNSYWTPCDDRRCLGDENNCRERDCTTKQGTIEKIVYWKDNVTASGLFKCSANDNDATTAFIPIIVTDITDAQDNRGIDLKITEPSVREDILDGDNVTIKLSLQKQYATVFCRFEAGDSSPGAESSMIFKSFAKNFADHPLKFASDWLVNSTQPSRYKITVDESSVYSNNIYIRIENVSHVQNNGFVNCTAADYGDTVNSNSVQLRVQQPVSPRFDPLPSSNAEGYELSKPVAIPCSAYGVPSPKIEWYKKDWSMTFDGPNLEIASFNDSYVGDYCCSIANKVSSDRSCVTLKKSKPPYNPNEFSLDSLSKLIFVIMTACTVVLLTVTPMSFQRRTARKEELKNLHMLILKESTESNNLLTEPTLDPKISVAQQIDKLPYNSKFEIPRDMFHILAPVGIGFSGRVFKADVTSQDGSSKIAGVKTTKDPRNVEQIRALLHEMKLMLHIGLHKNVLALIGACTSHLADGDLYVLVEFCEFGSLDDFLFKSRNSFVDELMNDDIISQLGLELFDDTSSSPLNDDFPRVTTKDLLSYGYQTATGADYLAARGIVHRDLATRNLLLTKDGTIKIGDFGLSRCDQYYQKVKGQCLPYKWMALESVLHRKYSEKSDVWSFGIVLWEIFSLAEEPYSGLTFDRSLIVWLSNGNRLHRPPYSPESMHNLMTDCWKEKPEDRPDFFQCRSIIQRITEELFPDSASLADSNYITLPTPLAGGAYHPVLRLSTEDSAYSGSIDNSVENLTYMRYAP